MAIGDRIPTELVPSPTALGITAVTLFTNTSASFRTQMSGIWLCNTGASTRNISLYKNGLLATHQFGNSIQLTANASVFIPLTGSPLVFTGTQTFGAKQDVGTDVNILCVGIVEQIA